MKDLIEKTIKDILLNKARIFKVEMPLSIYRDNRNGISYPGDMYAYSDWETVINDTENYLPENLLNMTNYKSLVNISGGYNAYKSFKQDIAPGISLCMSVVHHSLSGVGLDKGYELSFGINYHGNAIALYHSKYDTTKQVATYEIQGIITDIFKHLKLEDFKEYKNGEFYFTEYNIINASVPTIDLYALLKLCVIGDTFYITDSFTQAIGYTHGEPDVFFPEDLFTKLNVKKIVIKCAHGYNKFLNHFVFETGTEIDIQYEKPSNPKNCYSPKNRKEISDYIIKDNPCIREFLVEDLKNKASRIEFLEKEWEVYNQQIQITFKYGNVNGIVFTNNYCLREFKKFYDGLETVSLDVAGHELCLSQAAFRKCFKIEKLKRTKRIETAIDVFGETVGYTEFWKKSFNTAPERI
ncbi:MAG: hypothetical protein WC979_00995 [Candidatus Pacearchaeota archaeon]|jgi:hypothetical protein|nr:hypothetical protein [Clostridia bacterium]